MTALEQTAATLRPWLGSAFVAGHAELMQRISIRLTHFVPGRDSLQGLATAMDSLLFMAVRDQTGGRMVLQLDDGKLMRVKLNDFAMMADELLYILLAALPRTAASYATLNEHAIRQGSLAALKALHLHYEAFQSEDERKLNQRIIRTCHPPFRWRGWLDA